MQYFQELKKSFKPTTAAAVGGTAVLTWFFSAMQCNKEYCYTTDNPITQVALAGTLAAATVMAATSAPVVNAATPYLEPVVTKVNQAKTYLEGLFPSKKPAEEKTADATPAKAAASTAENPIAEQEIALPLLRTGSGIFTPKSDSVQANASDTPGTPHRTPSPSPVQQ